MYHSYYPIIPNKQCQYMLYMFTTYLKGVRIVVIGKVHVFVRSFSLWSFRSPREIFNRPGVAGAGLQTASSLVN